MKEIGVLTYFWLFPQITSHIWPPTSFDKRPFWEKRGKICEGRTCDIGFRLNCTSSWLGFQLVIQQRNITICHTHSSISFGALWFFKAITMTYCNGRSLVMSFIKGGMKCRLFRGDFQGGLNIHNNFRFYETFPPSAVGLKLKFFCQIFRGGRHFRLLLKKWNWKAV